MYDPARHEPLADREWDAGRARDAIAAICSDTEAAFDPARLWPLHPGDWEPGTPDVVQGLYLGAVGIVHALDRLAGVYEPTLDLAAIAAGLDEDVSDDPGAGASLLVGSSGMLVVRHRLAPSAATADALAAAIAAHVDHPANELLYGSPGTMLAARAMYDRTGEERFAELWRDSARTLLARRDEDGLWTQDLGSGPRRHVGAGHGFAGNVHVLRGAPEWLDDPAEVEARAVATARALAVLEDDVATWPVVYPESGQPRVQWCHGAPGVVIALAPLAPCDDEHGALMAAGGELVWRAGPIPANAGLCHGTGGNGFAFLALHARIGDELWLERARAFAMHALAQTERLETRHSLFTGDLGAALLAAACLHGDPAFPGLDDL